MAYFWCVSDCLCVLESEKETERQEQREKERQKGKEGEEGMNEEGKNKPSCFSKNVFLE